MDLAQLEKTVAELKAKVDRISAAVFHPGDRVHEIKRLFDAGRIDEAKRLMRGKA
jgi:hypothetical protein